MPLLCCTKCHHEWENSAASASEPGTCGWCGAAGRLLAATTHLEVFVRSGECLRPATELAAEATSEPVPEALAETK